MDRIDEKLLQPKVDHTPAEMDKVSLVILKAADLIEEFGWVQGTAYGYGEDLNRSPMCMFGALRRADRASNFDVCNEAVERVNRAVGGRFMANWNDVPGRTKAEVIAKLRAVALSA